MTLIGGGSGEGGEGVIPLHIYNRHMYRLAVNLRGCRYAGTLHRHIYRPKKNY